MKSFRRFFIMVIMAVIAGFCMANMFLMSAETDGGSPYRVEINRLTRAIEEYGFENIDLSGCLYVTDITFYKGNEPDNAFFEEADSDYQIRVIHGVTCRFDYVFQAKQEHGRIMLAVNLILAAMSLLLLGVLLFIRNKILKPFETLCEMPYQLSRGNLTVPVKEEKYRFFGRFVWGINMLRDNLEEHRQRELNLQREKKLLVLSLSHDIKTPLSAIKLYAKALSKGLYHEEEKQLEIAGNISGKADEIEGFLSQIIKASNEDFLNLEVEPGEFYLSELMNAVYNYYREKLGIMKIGLSIEKYSDCLLRGDLDRSIEVLQNIMENAVKYGDGDKITIMFSEEEGCGLITVKNTGCTLPEEELPHIFESFIRGTNADKISGSGLGLYICRQLMHKMQGEIFAEIREGQISVTVIFGMV